MMKDTNHHEPATVQPNASAGAAEAWARQPARERPTHLALVESPAEDPTDAPKPITSAPPPRLPAPDVPFGTCQVPSCGEHTRVLDAESHGGRALCVRCGRTEPLAAHVVREATTPRIVALAVIGVVAALPAGLILAFASPKLPLVALLVLGLATILGAVVGWLVLATAHAVRQRRRLRWATSWQLDEQTLPGWGVRQAALLGLLRDLRIGDTRSLEDVVWKAQRDAEDAVRKVWIAPHDPETEQHLDRVRLFGPYMDAVVRSFIARLSRNPPVETELHALVDALQEAMDG